jgi:hypothetical protein
LNAEKKINPLLSLTLSEEYRTDENMSELGTYFTDLGISYKFRNFLHFSANIRYINKLKKDNSYNPRYRYYFDLTLKKKFKPVILQFRTRFQGQYNKIYNSPDDAGPFYYSRNKLTVKLDLDKKYVPFVAVDISSPLNNSLGYYIDVAKYYAGIEYNFNRMHDIEIYYLFQQKYSNKEPNNNFIVGLKYHIAF